MLNVGDIMAGAVKDALNINEEMFLNRFQICKKCPLFIESKFGPLCNPKLWINKEDEISEKKKEGYTQGCGCKLDWKPRNKNNHCIINKW